MIALSFVSLIEAYSFVLIGIYVIKLNSKEKLNIMAALVYFSFAIWSLFYTFLYIAPTKDMAMFWHRIASFGWELFCPLAAQFFLTLSNKINKRNASWIYILLYLIPVAIICNALFNPEGTSVATGFIQSSRGVGWVYATNIKSIWYWIYLLHLILYFSIVLQGLYSWAKKSRRQRLIKQAKSIIALDVFVLCIGGFSDLILPVIDLNVPPICNLVTIIWGIGFLYIIRNMKLLSSVDAATPDLILKTVVDPILMLNRQGRIIKCNHATEEMLKLQSKQIISRPLSDFYKTRQYNKERINQLFRGEMLHDVEVDFLDSEGETIITRTSFSPAISKLDGVVGIVVNIHDVTAIKKAERELLESNKKYMDLSKRLEICANHDVLTGLPNRRQFVERVDKAISEYLDNGKKFALVFIDLDGFKAVNDIFGHDIGDKLLQKISEIFRLSIRKTDLVSRIGGDEFVLFVDLGDGFEIDILVQRINNAFRNPIIIENNSCKTDVSFGISKCPEDGITRDELIKIADHRMYKRKNDKYKYNFEE